MALRTIFLQCGVTFDSSKFNATHDDYANHGDVENIIAAKLGHILNKAVLSDPELQKMCILELGDLEVAPGEFGSDDEDEFEEDDESTLQ